MTPSRFSEPYSATGSLAAEGVLNQLGRPDIEAFEMLTREAVQNSWDAKRFDSPLVTVEIGRSALEGARLDYLRREVLVDPPPELPLRSELTGPRCELLYFADFGTGGLDGPTRADQPRGDSDNDFVDFVRNIGSPPDKEFGGGSFGYGKAAFYIASRARTILVDTLCTAADGTLERRFIACGIGNNYESEGSLYTGRHWWGEIRDGVPEPLVGLDAERAATELGLPARSGSDGLGTTIAIVAPMSDADDADGAQMMGFIAESLAWNFWPKMVATPGAAQETFRFRVRNDGRSITVPNPRTHPRLRGFVEALDRLRTADIEDEDELGLTVDRAIRCFRPIKDLGRCVIQRGPLDPVHLPTDRPAPKGARDTADSVHHIALMRNAELVVRYLPGPEPTGGSRSGYSGVFKCDPGVDQAFRSAEPPTHDTWNPEALPKGHERTFVRKGLERIREVCREAAGFGIATATATSADAVPLGEFADALAQLMPGFDGPGARTRAATPAQARSTRSASGKRRTTAPATTESEGWVDAATDVHGSPLSDDPSLGARQQTTEASVAKVPPPRTRKTGPPQLAVAETGEPVVRFPFGLRTHGRPVELSGSVQVMTNDGTNVETEPPAGWTAPSIGNWIDPEGGHHPGARITTALEGDWVAEVPLVEQVMVRLVLEVALP